MIMNNQYIKNFFLHLKEIDNRNLPSAVKFILFPDKLTKTELNVMKYHMDVTTRTKIFNKMTNNKICDISQKRKKRKMSRKNKNIKLK